MMREAIEESLADRFRQTGYLAFGSHDCPFSPEERARIRHLVMNDPDRFVVVTTGDTDEAVSVRVHRLLVDGERPRATDAVLVDALLAIVAAPGKLALYETILASDPLVVRRMQAHELAEGEFIGRHRDSESSKRYLAAVIVQLNAAEAGGAFAIYPPDRPALLLHDFTVLVTDAELEHEVTPVTAGQRCTLAFWLARAETC
ncbi:2OG-Fe(II) oxygenase [Bradyrhizobium brasilense]|uniref:2OG-Fe(II) oxygenase family protein n=1 Tax=Bradyrhizobium brasilense TaxID=1419277 RepID=UPI0024B06C52|nr:2OG-Fe(II) oxygenase [Bradyrhizobium australafricanum]WFU31436.1 2OG-Fe(II) oxygenase [Bradyrhizobium australafricanum]